MKRITKQLSIATILAAIFCSCGPTTEDILKKYKEFPEVEAVHNKLGIKIEADMKFSFKNTFVNLVGAKNHMEIQSNLSEMGDILRNRFIVLDAENPTKLLEFTTTHYEAHGAVPNIVVRPSGSDKSRPQFIIVGFKGIKESESAKWATPSLFYIFTKVKDDMWYNYNLITPNPLLARTLFDTNYTDAQFVEISPIIPVIIKTVYSGQVVIGAGKTLSISFNCISEDGKKRIEKCEIDITTRTHNANGTTRDVGNKFYGYDIDLGVDGKFSQKTSDYFINGSVTKERIIGSVRVKGTSYTYSAKIENPI